MMKSTAEIIALSARKKTHPMLFAAVGFLAGIAAALVWLAGDALPEFPVQPTKDTAHSEGAFPKNERVFVQTQPAGESVVVTTLRAPTDAVWVVVHERSGITLGNALGAVKSMGDGTDVSVPLLRNTEPGHDYAVLLYRDDGDGEFNLANDSVYIDFATGERVVSVFSTTP